MTERLLGYTDLRERGIRFSREHLWRLCKRGLFPMPVKISPGARNLWWESDVEAWIRNLSKIAPNVAPDAKTAAG